MLAVIRCVVRACRELGIEFHFVDDNRNVICVDFGKKFYFANFATPFGRHDVVRICKDKEFTYRTLKNHLRLPRTKGYLDPQCRKEFRMYSPYGSRREIVDAVVEDFRLPVVVKPNQGTRGRNVSLCRDRKDIERAMRRIFAKNSRFYDYVLVAQEHISIKKEFRIIVMGEEILLAYEKDIRKARFTGNLSPLHWENSHAVPIRDFETIDSLKDFIRPIAPVLELEYAGLDVAEDREGLLWLLEINSQPDFYYFIRDNGDDEIVKVYKRLLENLRKRA